MQAEIATTSCIEMVATIMRTAAMCWLGVALASEARADSTNLLERALAVRPSSRQLEWQAREVEAFIHFSMNTFIDSEGGTAPPAAKVFNPRSVDTAQWLDAAQSFGARGIVLVCKHAEGFCLWPTKTTPYSVAASPWRDGKGDLVREVSTECHRRGLPFGVYLSPLDIHYRSAGGGATAYGPYFEAQLTELLTGYGPISEVWFDGFGASNYHVQQWNDYYALIRKLQPNAVIVTRGPDVRWVGNESGYGRESEWSVVTLPKPPEAWDWEDMTGGDLGSRKHLERGGYPVWYPAVTDVSLRHHWFWHPQSDTWVRSPEELCRIYQNSVGKNSSLLLNLSPDNRGLIADADLTALKEFGRRTKEWFAQDLSPIDFGDWHLGESNQWTCTVQFSSPTSVNTLVLQEDLRHGQRVEHFSVSDPTREGSGPLAHAHTVGWKRILSLPEGSYSQLSITVDQYRAEPRLLKPAFYFRRNIPSENQLRRGN